MSAAPEYRPQYTVDDYMQWEGDWELWGGYPVSMSPSPFGRHQAIATKLARLVGNAIDAEKCNALLIAEIDWIVDRSTVVRPDFVAICGDAPERHVISPPALAVEVVSPTSKDRDQVYKRDLYRDKKVGNYLIVDPQQRSITLHRQANQWIEEAIEETLEIDICGDCQLEVDLSGLLN